MIISLSSNYMGKRIIAHLPLCESVTCRVGVVTVVAGAIIGGIVGHTWLGRGRMGALVGGILGAAVVDAIIWWPQEGGVVYN